MLKAIIWFLVINFSIYNTIFTEPTDYWLILEIIAVLISIHMAKEN
jgi:hypothetical protein